jgi:N-acetylmuramoyl-L-alanine amidase
MIAKPSPNHSARVGPIRCITIHADASPTEQATISWVQSKKSQVSYHVLIGRDGTCFRFVDDTRSAWANGKSAWRGITATNSASLTVAVSNRQDKKEPITNEQFAMLRAVVEEWRLKYPLIEAVTTHQRIARPIGRKHDPEAAPNWTVDVERMLGVTDN